MSHPEWAEACSVAQHSLRRSRGGGGAPEAEMLLREGCEGGVRQEQQRAPVPPDGPDWRGEALKPLSGPSTGTGDDLTLPSSLLLPGGGGNLRRGCGSHSSCIRKPILNGA